MTLLQKVFGLTEEGKAAQYQWKEGDGVVVYNLIVLDESGSMCGVRPQTISGCRETLQTIQAAQKEKPGIRQVTSIYAFQSGGKPSCYLAHDILTEDIEKTDIDGYDPDGCTPLFDALGFTLTELLGKVKRDDCTGMVTIITDGMENSSKEYSLRKVKHLISRLKEFGVAFTFIGANIDAQEEARKFDIKNAYQFKQTDEGMCSMFEAERRSRGNFYARMDALYSKGEGLSMEEKRARMRAMDEGLFEEAGTPSSRVTPNRIRSLNAGEIFVFGSNESGHHGGGAARMAMDKFGAVWGQGEGLQGQSYAIPTMEGLDNLKPAVERFVEFARQHPELHFLVTRIGCGIAGYKPEQIAPLFAEVKDLCNVSLPKDFWAVLRPELPY